MNKSQNPIYDISNESNNLGGGLTFDGMAAIHSSYPSSQHGASTAMEHQPPMNNQVASLAPLGSTGGKSIVFDLVILNASLSHRP